MVAAAKVIEVAPPVFAALAACAAWASVLTAERDRRRRHRKVVRGAARALSEDMLKVRKALDEAVDAGRRSALRQGELTLETWRDAGRILGEELDDDAFDVVMTAIDCVGLVVRLASGWHEDADFESTSEDPELRDAIVELEEAILMLERAADWSGAAMDVRLAREGFDRGPVDEDAEARFDEQMITEILDDDLRRDREAEDKDDAADPRSD